MALPKGPRGRSGPSNGILAGGARAGNVKDARDVIRGREQRPSTRNTGSGAPRILKTAHGLVTNKKAKGISTSQLKNRQYVPKKMTGLTTGARAPISKTAVGATIRKSAVIKSNPLLQCLFCLLMPMDSETNPASNNVSNNSPPGRTNFASTTAPASVASSAGGFEENANDFVSEQKPQNEQVSDSGRSKSEDVNRNNVPDLAQDTERSRQEDFARIRDSLERELNPGDNEALNGQKEVVEDPSTVEHPRYVPGGQGEGLSKAEHSKEEVGQSKAVAEVHVNIEDEATGAGPSGQPSPRKTVQLKDDLGDTTRVANGDHESDWEDEEKSNATSDGSDLDDFELPETCRVLTAPNGSTVYLVGTAHFSRKSQKDVKRTIRKVRPARVAVELCQQRAHMLTIDEKRFTETSRLNTTQVIEVVRQMGVMQGAMFLLMVQLSSYIASMLGMAPGGEFRVAYREAGRLRLGPVYLADRELNITLWRTWANLGVWQRLYIIWSFITTNEDISPEDIERCKEMDVLEQLLGELCADYPEMSKVILTERDYYLCRSLYDIAMMSPSPVSVVAVVGIGHQRGIEENWGRAEEINLQELMIVPQAPLSVRITGRVLRIGMWVTVGFVVYKLMPKTLKQGMARGLEKGTRVGLDRAAILWKGIGARVS